MGPGMVAHPCNSSYLGGRLWQGGLWLEASSDKKLARPISISKAGYGGVCHLGGCRSEDHNLRLDPGKNMRPYLKNNESKKRLSVWLK
jgi:hypothetical protein